VLAAGAQIALDPAPLERLRLRQPRIFTRAARGWQMSTM
jgi:hypothetical protein